MAVTGQQVFNIALGIMEETNSPASYSPYAPSILTLLQSELLPKDTTPVIISSLSDTLLLSDSLCLKVLPYGLAAHLLLEENPSKAAFFNARYDELKSKQSVAITSITDVYDITSGMV